MDPLQVLKTVFFYKVDNIPYTDNNFVYVQRFEEGSIYWLIFLQFHQYDTLLLMILDRLVHYNMCTIYVVT